MRCATVTTADIQLRYLCNSNMCPEFQFSFSFLMILAHFTIIFSFGFVDSILGSHCGAPFFHQCRSKCKHTLVHTHKRARVIQCVLGECRCERMLYAVFVPFPSFRYMFFFLMCVLMRDVVTVPRFHMFATLNGIHVMFAI